MAWGSNNLSPDRDLNSGREKNPSHATTIFCLNLSSQIFFFFLRPVGEFFFFSVTLEVVVAVSEQMFSYCSRSYRMFFSPSSRLTSFVSLLFPELQLRLKLNN